MDRPKVQKADNTYGVYAETESVKLFQLRRMKRRGLEMDRPKVQKAANTYGVRIDRIGKTFPGKQFCCCSSIIHWLGSDSEVEARFHRSILIHPRKQNVDSFCTRKADSSEEGCIATNSS